MVRCQILLLLLLSIYPAITFTVILPSISLFFSFLPSLDNEDPVFSGCPTNINELLPASQLPVTVSWTAPTATDNTGNVSLDVNIESGSSFPEGTHEISYTANDDYGNSDVCVFSVIVTG